MRCLLLAAGFGSRLKPITTTIPKCMVEINGKPLLEYWLELLFSGSIEKVLVNTHYLPSVIEQYIKQSRWSDKIEIVYEPQLLGTAGTIVTNISFFEGKPCMIAHADNLTVFNVNDFINHHANRPSCTELTMMTFITDKPQSCGIVQVSDEGIVREYHEKVPDPPGNLANGAVFIFEPSVLEYICANYSESRNDICKDIIPEFVNRISVYKNYIYHRDIGTPKSLESAREEIKNISTNASA